MADGMSEPGVFLLAIIMVGLGVFFGYSIWYPGKTDRQQIICTDYLQGTWHHDVCVKDGRVVPTKP